jgi:conjugal transfer pilus assembly protein TrbC
LTATLVTAVAAVAPSVVAQHGTLGSELERLIETERARSRELLERIDSGQAARNPTRTMPSVGAPSGRAPDPATIAERYRQSAGLAAPTGGALLVFASFSMPHESLLRLAAQTRAADGVLLFRGLAGTTLGQMTARLQPLARTGAAIQIHPQAFERFGVQLVPTFVVVEEEGGCGASSCEARWRRVAGDVSLDHALERLAREPDELGYAADARLRRLRTGG